MRVEALRPEAPVERFDVGVVGRLAWPTEVQRNAFGVGPKVEITLGQKNECIQPGKHCDALAEEGKSDIKAENGTLTVLLTGVTAAHCFIGAHSYGIQTFQLTQEFDIACTDPAVTQVAVLCLTS